MRDPKKYTVNQLLSSDEQFVVPRYQRGYDWKGRDQVSDLFMDIKDCMSSESNENLFLGTMIFDVSRETDEVLEVIDGQQRLTTLLIILIACREYIKANFDDPKLNKTARKLLNGMQDLISTSDSLGEDICQQLVPSDTISDIFALMCDEDWDGEFPTSIKVSANKTKQIRLQVRRVKPIFQESMKEIKLFCADAPSRIREMLEQIYKRTYIIRIDIEHRSEAFEIFERTNARGKDLEVADLLKNFLFSKEKDFKTVQEAWERIEENSRSSILRMLKYFWNTRQGSISNRDLYKKITKYAKQHGEKIEGFVNELEQFSEFYSAYYSNKRDDFKDWLIEQGYSNKDSYLSEASRIVGSMNAFNIHQTTPLIFSAIQCHIRCEEKPKSLLSFMRFIEGYHFVNSKVCGRPGNEVESIYTEFCVKFSKSSNFSKVFGALSERLSGQISNRAQFISDFCELNYQDNYPIVRYVFDRLINDGVKGPRINIFDYYDSKKTTSSFTIEHIFPQSFAKNFPGDDRSEYVNVIGNLMILSEQENGALGSKSFEDKISILSEPHKHKTKIKNISTHVQIFLEENKGKTEWSSGEIQQRGGKLAKDMYELIRERFQY